MVGAFNYATGVVTVQTLEATPGKIYPQLRILFHRMPDVVDQLIISISHQHPGKTSG